MYTTQDLRPELAPFRLDQHDAIIDLAFAYRDVWIDGGHTTRQPTTNERYTWFLKANGGPAARPFYAMCELISPLISHAAGHTLAEMMINYYAQDHHLMYHRDTDKEPNYSMVYVADLVAPGRMDFLFDPNPSHDEYPDDHERVDHTLAMRPGDVAWWTSDMERAGWFHGGMFPAGRMSLVCRFEE